LAGRHLTGRDVPAEVLSTSPSGSWNTSGRPRIRLFADRLSEEVAGTVATQPCRHRAAPHAEEHRRGEHRLYERFVQVYGSGPVANKVKP